MNNTIREVVNIIYKNALKRGIIVGSIIAVVDFTKPSNQKRLQVIEMNHYKVLMDMYVAHGVNSGGLYPTKFSNTEGSHQSSIGVYKTDGTYYGKYGRSLTLDGLEIGFNDNVRDRVIVIHKSSYIGNGRTGRSWGCFAVPAKDKDALIDLIREGHLLIAYYPDPTWLKESIFIKKIE